MIRLELSFISVFPYQNFLTLIVALRLEISEQAVETLLLISLTYVHECIKGKEVKNLRAASFYL